MNKKLDPRAKLLFLIAVVITVIGIPKVVLAIFLFTVLLILSTLMGLHRSWLSYLSPLAVFLPILFVLNLFFYAGGETILGVNFFIPIEITTQGLNRSILICSRLLVVAATAAWFVIDVDPEEFELALKEIGFPWKLAFIFSLTLKLVPVMKRKFKEIEQAQMSRGLEIKGGPLSRARARIPIMVPFLASIARYGSELSDVLKVRNFGREKTYMENLNYGTLDWLFTVFTSLLFATSVVLFGI